jgi:peptide/nickel transport system ATP-binding protein
MSESPFPEMALEGRGLTKAYTVRRRGRAAYRGRRDSLVAVDDVTVSLPARKVTAIVGESGSGKSTLARLMAALERPTSGGLWLGDRPVRLGGARRMRPFRRQVQMIFQDPFASLNPVHTIGHHLMRPLVIHELVSGDAEATAEVERLLSRVNLTPGSQFLDRYPHELSGGQRQRVSIARALAVQPRVLLADEPVSMLDVSIRMGILNLLADLGASEQMAILYITHDIASARYFADSLSVMYAGRLVEGGTAEDVTQEPAHPYTQVLIDAAPDPDRLEQGRRRTVGPGATPPGAATGGGSGGGSGGGGGGGGCSFQPRCPSAMPRCAEAAPPPLAVRSGHWAACWLYDGAPGPPVSVELSAPGAKDAEPGGRTTRQSEDAAPGRGQEIESGESSR